VHNENNNNESEFVQRTEVAIIFNTLSSQTKWEYSL